LPSTPLQNPPGIFRRLGAAGPAVLVLSILPPLGSFLLLATLTTLAPWLRENVALGLVLYFFAATALVGLSLLPSFAAAMFAGWTFGFGLGVASSMAACTAASLVAYALGRWIARDRVVALIAENPAAQAVHRALLGDWRRIVLVTALLRLSPLPSFAVVNFSLASARTPLGGCTVGTVIGLVPRTAAAAFVAAGIEKLHTEKLTDTPLWVSIGGLVAFVFTSLAIGLLARRALTRMSRS
jgi:uncharacterized membrane protein YdjX (TVP38/TMEM64 family)